MESAEDTSVNLQDFGFTPTVSRSEPQLRWTDLSGSHSYLLAGRKLIGSAKDVDVVVNALAVSRLHAALEVQADGVWICDLGSRNGTYVGGIRVESARVPDQGIIHVGTADLTLCYDQNASEVELWPSEQYGKLLGRSVIMRELFSRLDRIAQLDSTVLITGETGTGKELVARAIHDASPRSEKPYVVVDCGALAESLLEAELFGHTKGAFTGAAGARAGAIEAGAPAARCSSTRSARCRCRCSRSCCVRSKDAWSGAPAPVSRSSPGTSSFRKAMPVAMSSARQPISAPSDSCQHRGSDLRSGRR